MEGRKEEWNTVFLQRGALTAHIVPGGDRVVIYDSMAAASRRTAVTAPASLVVVRQISPPPGQRQAQGRDAES